ncbi:unnamed protein product [Gongylonema pulchrum]|uniref:G_PROTEIN_RECEP_F1_2 domain-containing protein n=1 Tax=Gongylonema pulchrum TaxID=637853 RepID=A0A183EPW1_9BILA|nr:unnamed protein product [Gongylonema pulchrum]
MDDALQRVRQRRKKRDATRMMISLISMYLITNTPNLLITFWEHIHIDSLRGVADGLMYRYYSFNWS